MNKIVKSECEVLLIYPPYFRLLGEFRAWYPLGVGYLASYLNSFGIPTKVYNADTELFKNENIISYKDKFYKSEAVLPNKNEQFILHEMKNVLKSLQPRIIGISVLTENIPLINDIIQVCHDSLSNVPIIIGGAHTLISQNLTKEICDWDYILIGDAEESLFALVKYLLGLNSSPSLKEIDGLIYKEDERIRNNGILKISDNLDCLPFPNLRDMYSFNIDLKEKFKKVMISTTRGCPFKCTFCYMNKYYKEMRYRSPESVIKEIEFNAFSFDITKFYFIDDSFGTNKSFFYDLCNLINSLSFDIKWSCMTHEKLISRERLETMKKAGCDSIHLGIESGSDRILKLLGKKTTVSQIETKARLINDAGLKLKAFFMVGMPTETEEDIKKSMELLKKIEPHEAILQIYVPYPNTKLYDYINENICNIASFYNWSNFYKAKINYQMIGEIHQKRFDTLLKNFFNLVEEINEENKVYG
ncbi:MAG: hypothetical protein AEth_01290 [Candidatus Argoarchaeum ethanivorans]|uniref:Radical SAM protein n=1 Tax=Candidatus Argoarchaeum ethanivorans TaxID=2608793 RepID=A0A8B3S2U8_9EURY|nr:MAG: hypothetical protein AEth_01290 [Candidatus Argoarchaeum ethanivorans]